MVAKAVLPVVFAKASSKLIAEIEKYEPDAVIALGQAEGRREITLERFALNIADAKIADNAGNIPTNQVIIPDAPAAYITTLPVGALRQTINDAGVPTSISNHAGTFVCNDLFFNLQNYLFGSRTISGFVHVPLMTEQSAEFPGLPTMPLAEMIRGLTAALDLLSN